MGRPIHCGAHGWEDSDDEDCKKCWQREIDEEEKYNLYKPGVFLTGEDMRRIGRLVDRVGHSGNEVISAALKLYEDYLETLTSIIEKCPEEARCLEVKAYINRKKHSVDISEVVLK
jgi:hypothetical protein